MIVVVSVLADGRKLKPFVVLKRTLLLELILMK
jgi:hypothetical protein